MTVEELYDRLRHLMEVDPSCKKNIIGTPIKNSKAFGGTPIKELQGIYNGFDWNKDITFLQF